MVRRGSGRSGGEGKKEEGRSEREGEWRKKRNIIVDDYFLYLQHHLVYFRFVSCSGLV
mgnify:CR=1 FL=1